jgi:hypothetical protein
MNPNPPMRRALPRNSELCLTGRTMHRWRLDGGGTVTARIRGLSAERQVTGAQPNYLSRPARRMRVR